MINTTRREFLSIIGMGSLAFFMSPLGFCCSVPKKQPNLLFLFADDQSHEALSVLGSEVQTPNLDRLVKNGVTFTNAYNMGAWHGAVCVASRTMLNTGRFLWNAKDLEPNLPQECENGRLWAQYLAQVGYDTYFSGKWHIKVAAENVFHIVKHVRPGMPNQTPEGYHRPIEDEPDSWNPWDTKFEGFWKGGKHWSEVLGDDAVEFLGQAAESDNPFFMYLAFNAPHDPRQSPRQYVEEYPLDHVKLPENYLSEYPYKEDIGCGKGLRDEKLAPFPRTEYAVKVHRQEYYAIISHMDNQIGRILDALQKSGKLDNSYIFFTADHGLAVGQHGLMGKQNMFEHSVKAPLIITGADVPKNVRINIPVYLQDIMPSTLELAGVEIPDHVQFKSLMPLIAGKRQNNYEAIYGGYMDVQRMVRQDNYKLIIYPKIEKKLLFNLKDDPMEMNNLADDPVYASRIQTMIETLTRLQKETGDTLKIGY